MSVGWGFRGDYGHEAGAMVPGALLGLAICLGSGREDWLKRSAIIGMCGAIGWAFGGQMSYGRIIGYTASCSLPNVAYGYGCLFIVGGLWAGIGCGLLAMSLTQPGSYLERFVGPLAALLAVWVAMHLTGLTQILVERWYLHDTDWVGASSAVIVAILYGLALPRTRPACVLIGILAGSWWAGYLLLTVALDLHMTPPRSDNWSGCTGLFVGLIVYLVRRRDRAATTMMAWGFLSGGIGFVVGDFVNMLGRAQWGPIGHFGSLQGLDYWKWMEQLFGLIMGLGVARAFLRIMQPRLVKMAKDRPQRWLETGALFFLLVLMFWANLHKNVKSWKSGDYVPDLLLGMDVEYGFLIIAVMLSAIPILAIVRHHRKRLSIAPGTDYGKAQLLFLTILWVAIIGALLQVFPRISDKAVLFVHFTFWVTGAACSIIALCLPASPGPRQMGTQSPPDGTWRLGKKYWACCVLISILVLLLSYLTVLSHNEDLPGSHLRFSPRSDVPAHPNGTK